MLGRTLIGRQPRIVALETFRERPRHRGRAGGIEVQAATLKFGARFIALGARLVAPIHCPSEKGIRERNVGRPAVRAEINAWCVGIDRRNYHHPANQKEDPQPQGTSQPVQSKPPAKKRTCARRCVSAAFYLVHGGFVALPVFRGCPRYAARRDRF